MSKPLPLRANLEWLKKACKDRLDAMRAQDPAAQLSDAQLAVARDHGFSSWPKLKVHVENLRGTLAAFEATASPNPAPVAPDDPDLAALFAAIRDGDTKGVSDLLTRRRELASARDALGRTPLHAAAQHDDPKLCLFLLTCGADPNATYGESAHTPLSWAVTCRAEHAARALVRLGSKPDLFCAAGIGDLEAVTACFDEKGVLRPRASRTGSTRFTPDGSRLPAPPPDPADQIADALCMAARNARAEIIRFLLTKRPNLAFRAYIGATALHWAYFAGSQECIKLLEHAGADPNARDDEFHATPHAFGVIVAASWGIPALVRAHLQADPSLANLVDARTSALHEAARNGSAEIVRLLLNAGADPCLRNHESETPLDLATRHRHEAVMDLLADPRT